LLEGGPLVAAAKDASLAGDPGRTVVAVVAGDPAAGPGRGCAGEALAAILAKSGAVPAQRRAFVAGLGHGMAAMATGAYPNPVAQVEVEGCIPAVAARTTDIKLLSDGGVDARSLQASSASARSLEWP